jgi:asparagine synthase (glutamine-hydrolysing)
MCGVVGVVARSPIGTVSDAVLEALHHRGPDARGSQMLRIGAAHAWLGHTRLSILDLSPAGQQPMRSCDGRWWLSYNGEIYNHLELRRELDVPWRGHSDTETLAECLAAWGADATLARLNGIFAFAALDTVARKLYLVRDPFGVKPLYYAAHGRDGLAFASELKALALIAGGAPRVNGAALRAFLALRFVPSPSTLLAGMQRLPPGHLLERELETGTEKLRCYSSYPHEPFRGTLDEAVEGYYALLSQAVKRQLLSDVPVGIFLSGGIDSGLIAALSAAHAGRVPTYTVGFGAEHESCELADGADTATILGLEHHPVPVTPQDIWDVFERCVAAVEEPLATPSVLPMWHLARRAREDVTVVLTGQGTDEPWGGYRRYQGELWRERIPFPAVMAWMRPLLHHVPRVPEVLERAAASLPIADRTQRFIESYTPFPAPLRRSLTGSPDPGCAVSSIGYWLDWLGGEPMPDVQAMMAIDARLGLADNLLLYGDKIAMAHSLEARVPMLDVELMRFVESLPLAYRLSLGGGKIAHKRAAARHLTAAIVRRPKRDFPMPFAVWSRTLWKDRLRELLLDPPAAIWTWFRREGVERLLDEHLCGRRERSVQVFALASLFLWWRQSGAK